MVFRRTRRRKRTAPADVIALKTCGNLACFAVYPRYKRECPFCGPPSQIRAKPEQVDGDLFELDAKRYPAYGAKLKPYLMRPVFHPIYHKSHSFPSLNVTENVKHQTELRDVIAQWAGYRKQEGLTDKARSTAGFILPSVLILAQLAHGVVKKWLNAKYTRGLLTV